MYAGGGDRHVSDDLPPNTFFAWPTSFFSAIGSRFIFSLLLLPLARGVLPLPPHVSPLFHFEVFVRLLVPLKRVCYSMEDSTTVCKKAEDKQKVTAYFRVN